VIAALFGSSPSVCRADGLAAGKEREREEKKKNLRSLFGFFFFFSMNWVRCIRTPPKWRRGRPVRLDCLPSIGPQDPAIRHRHFADDPANLGAGDIWARAGPYQVEVRACPLRQVQKTRGGVGVLPYPTARAAFHASGFGRCDGRHRLLFECPIIFWTPCAPLHFTGRNI